MLDRHRPTATPLLLALAITANLAACSDVEDDVTFRDSDVLDEIDPDLQPDPEPQPDPVKAEALVGMHIDDFHTISAFVDSYEMFPYPSAAYPFNAAADLWYEWPLHAMEWKDHASGYAHNFDLAAAEAAVDNSPTNLGFSVKPGDIIELDGMEAGGVVFSSDPSGTWMQANFTDPAQGLVFAALVMHHWKTPVYSASEHFDHQTNGSVMSHAVALQRLQFTLVSAPNLFAACGLDKQTATPTDSLGNVPYCNHGAVLTGDQVSLWNSIWGAPGSWTPYEANVNLTPNDLVAAYNNNYMGMQGQLVFDPPGDASQEDIAGLAVLAHELADQTLVEGDDGYLVMLRDYVGPKKG